METRDRQTTVATQLHLIKYIWSWLWLNKRFTCQTIECGLDGLGLNPRFKYRLIFSFIGGKFEQNSIDKFFSVSQSLLVSGNKKARFS